MDIHVIDERGDSYASGHLLVTSMRTFPTRFAAARRPLTMNNISPSRIILTACNVHQTIGRRLKVWLNMDSSATAKVVLGTALIKGIQPEER